MNLREKYPTDYRLWGLLSAGLFVGAWFLPMDVKGSSMFVGRILIIFVTQDYICSPWEMLSVIGAFAAVFALVAVVLGWIIQCFATVIVTAARQARKKQKLKPNHGLESTGAPPAAETPETHP
ncbi:MAG TPA: hypothetical protein PLE77_13530 [Kiritimatiellia bacterium]|nr:hypothetical protein [Kiritimatiellia bacterium]